MLLLLPPSEGKTPAASGDPVDLDALTDSAILGDRRQVVLHALMKVSAWPDAAAVLGVGASLAGEVARNVRLCLEPAGPAREVYSGVLFAAAGLASLPADALARADASVRVFSGLWGIVAPSDLIPAYRLSMAVDLPGAGRLAAGWRAPLADALDGRGRDELVVDCRSAPYQGAWRPPPGSDWVSVRVVRQVGDRRVVVSHNAKHTRGALVRHLLTRPAAPPRNAEEALAAAGELVGAVVGTDATGRPFRLIDAVLAPASARDRALEMTLARHNC